MTAQITPKSDRRIRRETVRVKNREYERWMLYLGKVNGKRIRKSFSSEQAALKHLAEIEQKAERIGRKAAKLSDAVLEDAVQAVDILDGCATLSKAAEFYKRHMSLKGASLTVADVIDEYIADAETCGLREKSLQDLRLRLARLSEQFGSRMMAEISRRDAVRWLRSLTNRKGGELSPLSIRHYSTVAGGLFNYAIDQEYIDDNPFTKRSKSRRKLIEDQKMPKILTPDKVSSVMKAARRYLCSTSTQTVESMVPCFALGFFAGIRTAELRRLDWSHVNLKKGHIEIPIEVVKKRSVRYVKIEPNLRQWLAPYVRDSGAIAPQGQAWRYHFDGVRKLAKLDYWPSNCMRHSFASYHLAKYGDRRRTELELGRRSEDLLYTHYRALATEEEAHEYWSIRPQAI